MQALGYRQRAPGVGHYLNFALLLDCFGEVHEALGGVGAAVEQHVLDVFEQVLSEAHYT